LKYVFFSWDDEDYKNMMFEVLMSLEPRLEEANVTIIEENGEWLEVLFFKTGIIIAGYELNRKKHYVLTFDSSKPKEDKKNNKKKAF
jgi:hypothetical protein